MTRKCTNLYSYDGEELTRDELLEKPEVLKYLRRKGMEKNKMALLRRFYKELKKGNITKEVVLGQRPKGKRGPKCKKYSYEGEELTRNELLEKPEILRYLRQNGMEKSKAVLLTRFYREVKKGNITKEVVLGQKPKCKKYPLLEKPKRKRYPYDGKKLTRDELLGEPEILEYLRRNGIEKSRATLFARFYYELKKGNITKEVALEPRVQREVVWRKPKPKTLQEKPSYCAVSTICEPIDYEKHKDDPLMAMCSPTIKRRKPIPRKKSYQPISLSQIGEMVTSEVDENEVEILKCLGLLP